MQLPATAHFSFYVVFIALTILCCFVCLVCLPPSTAADLSTHLCSPQTYIPLGRLSILNVWLLDYTFLDFYTSVSSEWIPQEWGYSAQGAFVPKISRHPSWPMHKKAACVPFRLPQTIPCLFLPTAAQPRRWKDFCVLLLPFLSGAAMNLVYSVSVCVSSIPLRC